MKIEVQAAAEFTGLLKITGPSDFSVGFERLTNNASTARDAKDARERQ